MGCRVAQLFENGSGARRGGTRGQGKSRAGHQYSRAEMPRAAGFGRLRCTSDGTIARFRATRLSRNASVRERASRGHRWSRGCLYFTTTILHVRRRMESRRRGHPWRPAMKRSSLHRGQVFQGPQVCILGCQKRRKARQLHALSEGSLGLAGGSGELRERPHQSVPSS